jgi:uncharacterized HAD superfamily protein/hypoxanthine-guanine phosphoribosyltransferase
MNYKSFGDLAYDIAANVWKIPSDIDLLVGIPRSGVMAAAMLALHINKKFCDLDAFIENRALKTGRTRRSGELTYPHDAKRVLIIDDSVDAGVSIVAAREALKPVQQGRDLLFAAVYVHSRSAHLVDIFFDRVEMPRVFAWNLFHRKELKNFCVDIDGVLCQDPTSAQNDDGQQYLNFLSAARPIARPSYEIGHLVSSRLERYRQPTIEWLDAQGITFGQLHLLDVSSAADRRRLGCHAKFKADIYRGIDSALLFVESEPDQAAQIARLTGKPVLDYANQRMATGTWNMARATAKGSKLKRRIIRRLQRVQADIKTAVNGGRPGKQVNRSCDTSTIIGDAREPDAATPLPSSDSS